MSKVLIIIEDLKKLTKSVIYNSNKVTDIKGVSIDTRTIKKGELYVAIKGDNFDGHDFVLQAIAKGASAVLVDKKKLKKFKDVNVPIVAVNNTKTALGELANIWRHKLNAKVIAITGSNGKTTTKEMLKSLLMVKYNVVATEKNNNNDIGVPLTIFRANNKTEVLVLECGTNHFGEINYLAEVAEPDMAIITNIGYSHLEFLNNKEGVLKEKRALLDKVNQRGGTVFINKDDELLKGISNEFVNVVTIGIQQKADYKGKIVKKDKLGFGILRITSRKRRMELTFTVLGSVNAKNLLAAASIAGELGLSKSEILKGIVGFSEVKQRQNLIRGKSQLIIDDSYNANPESMTAAFEWVSQFKGYTNRVAVLGDMFELGENSIKLHKGLSQSLTDNNFTTVILIGEMMRHLYNQLKKNNIEALYFSLREELALYLKQKDFRNSIVLVKGSRGMRMEEFVNILTASVKQAKEGK